MAQAGKLGLVLGGLLGDLGVGDLELVQGLLGNCQLFFKVLVFLDIRFQVLIDFGEFGVFSALLLVNPLGLICNPLLALLGRPDLLLQPLYLQILLIDLLLHLVLYLLILLQLCELILERILQSQHLSFPIRQLFVDLFEKMPVVG